MNNYIKNNYKGNNKILKNLYNYVAYHMMLIAVNFCFHPQNNMKLKSLKTICDREIFRLAIKNSNYDDLSLTRKITLFTLKYKLYFFTSLICNYRQYQFKKR